MNCFLWKVVTDLFENGQNLILFCLFARFQWAP